MRGRGASCASGGCSSPADRESAPAVLGAQDAEAAASRIRALENELAGLLQFRGDMPADRPRPKRPEVLVTTATSGEGVAELLAALDRHRSTVRDGLTSDARRARAVAQIRGVLADRFADRLREPTLAPLADSLIDEVAEHRLDPFAAADRLLEAIATTR